MLGCGRYKKQIQADAERLEDQYDEEMIDNLLTIMHDRLKGLSIDTIDEDLLEEIWLDWKEKLPDPGEWAYDMAVDRCIDAQEAKYDEMRDREMEERL